MRDIIVMMAFIGLLPLSFTRPFVGMLVWTWFAVMNPHREAFGFSLHFNFNVIIAAMTFIGLIVSGEKIKPIWNMGIALILMFFGWTLITTKMALLPVHSYDFLMHIPSKVYLYVVLLVIMLNREERVISLLWVLIFSLGYYGANIGILGILQFGNNIARTGNFGPYGTIIQDRNHMALGLCMIVPLLYYLITYVREKWVRISLWGVLGFTIVSILVSYSRGGWICLMAVGAYYFWFVKNKLFYISIGAFAGLLGAVIMADAWLERMSLSNLEEDGSFNGRLESWKLSLEVALNYPFTGAGFRGTEHIDIFNRFIYATKLEHPLAAHSIYFQVLGDHGFVGLGLFLLMILSGVIANFKTRQLTKDNPDMMWCRDLANSLQVSLGVFCLGGAALSLAYFDVFYIILILSLALLYLTQKNLVSTQTAKANISKKKPYLLFS